MTERPLATTVNSRRNAIVVGLGALATAGVTVAQSLVLTAIVGEGAETDAFLAAYSLFLPVALLGSSLRAQLVPLFGPLHPESGFRRQAAEIGGRAALLGALLAGLVALLAPWTARAVTNGLSGEEQDAAMTVLLLLAPAAFMHFRAAALSAVLAGARRFGASVALYLGSGLCGLAASATLIGPVGVEGAAIGVGVGAALLLAGHELYLRRYGMRLETRRAWLRERSQWMLSISLIGYSALGLAQPLNLSIALSGVSGTPGDITIYTFSFLMIGLLLNVSSVALSLVLLPDLVQDLPARGRRFAADHLVRVARLVFVLLVPLLAAYLAIGQELLRWLLSPIFSRQSIDLLFELGRIFSLVAVPLAIIQIAVSISVALRRWRLNLVIALGGICLQVGAVALASGDGPEAVAVAQVCSTTVTAVALLVGLFGRALPGLAHRLGKDLAASAGLSSVILLVALPFGSHPATPTAIAIGVVGLAGYLALLSLLWPSVAASLLRRPQPSGA